jgi:hypothetical protein
MLLILGPSGPWEWAVPTISYNTRTYATMNYRTLRTRPVHLLCLHVGNMIFSTQNVEYVSIRKIIQGGPKMYMQFNRGYLWTKPRS